MSKNSVDQDRYAEFISFFFERPTSDPAWYWSSDFCDFSASDVEILQLFELAMSRSGSDLLQFTNDQVADGLNCLLDEIGHSKLSYIIRDGDAPVSARVKAILSLEALYSDFLAIRCPDVLSHLPVTTKFERLSGTTYMLWEMTPLTYLQPILNLQERNSLANTVFKVLETVLLLPHFACAESALHGLNNMALYCPIKTARIVDKWMKTHKGKYVGSNEKLRALEQYALLAREGRAS